MSDNIPLPLVEVVKKWKRDYVITFLESKKDELGLDDIHIQVIQDQEVAGCDFLELNVEKLMRYGLKGGPAERIAGLVKEFKFSTSMETLPSIFEHMNVSHDSMDTSVSSSSFLSDFLKVIKENSEITKKSLKTLIRFEKDRNNRFISGQYMHEIAYQSIVFEKADQEYFLSKTSSYIGEFARNGSVNIYLRNNPAPTTTEDDVLDWFVKLMAELPNWKCPKKSVVKDTHTNPYLCGLKPDISVFIEEDVVHDVCIPTFVQTLLELKKRKRTFGFSDEEKGQLVDYIYFLVQQQPLRELFAIFLSDGYQFYVMAFDRNTKMYREFMTNFKTVMSTKIHLKECLGVGSTSTVYKVDWKDNPSALKVYKDGYNPSNEAKVLQYLNGKNVQNIPRYIAHDRHSMIISPVCEKISDQFQSFHVLQLLHLLEHIHSMNAIHRDVCPSNISLDTSNNSLVLVDWGSAIYTPTLTQLVEYEGTITFASPNILNNNMGYYQPKASDDLHSFIRTMYFLRNPSDMPTIPNGNLESKAQAIKEYWNDNVDVKLDGPLWIEMVNGANNRDYKILEKCCYIFKA
ncbi:hypothetical protein Glove_141g70 [Diversispora epigaea]|uniref:Protein kinase domain-containing protein n=1 Tax=Diversispora epigaea TaxID=1348612 RepID=A0A397J4E3_9GLOM|nr:hypothetical protein Glove_141g70 [Diversispora epigaea]